MFYKSACIFMAMVGANAMAADSAIELQQGENITVQCAPLVNPPPPPPPPPAVVSVKINFQPAASAVPDGYLVDSGATYSESRGYGWENTGVGTRDWDKNEDQALDTYAVAPKQNTWKYAAKNGRYLVSVASGDSANNQGAQYVSVQGQALINGEYPAKNTFIIKEVVVDVTDGFLTITVGSGSTYSLINYVIITPADDVGPPPPPPPTGGDVPIVYSWSKRSPTVSVEINGVTYPQLDLSTYDPIGPDVAFVFDNFKEANLVYRDSEGVETTIFDCISDTDLHCAALDGKTSPDGKKIAFAVLYGTGEKGYRYSIHGAIPNELLTGGYAAQIMIYDLASKTLEKWPLVNNQWDMHPDWVNNNKLVFVSTRAKVYPYWVPGESPTYKTKPALQRWTANIDGSNLVNIGQNDDTSLHPLPLLNGNIITAGLKLDGGFKGTDVVRQTNENLYWIMETDQFGGNEVSQLGAHGLIYVDYTIDADFNPVRLVSQTQSLIALHYFTQLSNSWICSGDYYRSRHSGLGHAICYKPQPFGVEGEPGSFQPKIVTMTPWAQEEDNPTFQDADGKFMGNAGFPSALPNNGLMMVHGKGYCYEGLALSKSNPDYLNGPGCDAGIYRFSVMPSQHPSDLIKIVDRDDRHEFAPDAVVPYQTIYGQPMPTQQTPPTPNGGCSIRVVNVHEAGLKTGKAGEECSKKAACVDAGFDPANVAKIGIIKYNPPTKPQNVLTGFPYWGDTELLGYAVPESDGSIYATIPCDTPYRLFGYDKDNKNIARDQIRWVNPHLSGTRTCQGCHAGHNTGDYKGDPTVLFKQTQAYKFGPKPLVK